MPNTARKKRAVVAISGGVDSSVAAALLARQDYDVIGLTMHIAPHMQPGEEGHCAPDMLEARRVAEHLGIPHHEMNLVADFEKTIISDFTREYASGRTPNPCVRCNRTIKFGPLFEKAMELGADYLATGHYARLEEDNGRMALYRAVDPGKDQSYVLAGLDQEHLRHALFPLGHQHKRETRAIARELGLSTAEKPGSKEVCFAPDADHKRFLTERLGKPDPGPILSQSGEELGTHQGLLYYTVGQRKGLGIAAPRPLFVIKLDPERNALIVGHEEETYSVELVAGEPNWVSMEPPSARFACEAQIRYNGAPAPCVVYPWENGFRIQFDAPVRSVAPGQWAVLYDGDKVLGNGIINDFVPAAPQPSA